MNTQQVRTESEIRDSLAEMERMHERAKGLKANAIKLKSETLEKEADKWLLTTKARAQILKWVLGEDYLDNEIPKQQDKEAVAEKDLVGKDLEKDLVASNIDTQITKQLSDRRVSFKLAHLLKDKGFDEPCTAHYKDSPFAGRAAAPTLGQAALWLKTKHNLDTIPNESSIIYNLTKLKY